MRLIALILIIVAQTASSHGKELLAVRCVTALINYEFSWHVEDHGSELVVRYCEPRHTPLIRSIFPKKTTSTKLVGRAADELRRDILALPLPLPAFDHPLTSGAVDGVAYFFKVSSGDEFVLDNPWFYFEHHPASNRTARLREVMRFVERLTGIAKTKERANKAPEPTSGIVTPPAEPGAAPIPPVAHL